MSLASEILKMLPKNAEIKMVDFMGLDRWCIFEQEKLPLVMVEPGEMPNYVGVSTVRLDINLRFNIHGAKFIGATHKNTYYIQEVE